MFFLDSTGVFSLICLLVQCGMAWIFAAFFAVVAAQRAPWLRSWSGAYLGMGLGLTALCVRFLLANHHVAGETTWRDGTLEVRAFYGLYTGGKVLFAWCFLAGASHLRKVPWPAGVLPPTAAVLLGVVVGAVAPTIEFILLFQVLWLPAVFLRVAWLLKLRADDQPGWGWLVPRTLWLWSAVWIVFGIATVIAGPLTPKALLPWTYILRINSLIDLTFQAVLATGLIVVVMSEAQRAVLAAIRERDRLRELVQRDEKLRALTTLVSGVAHEINNPLTAILGFADELASDDGSIRQRAAGIVREQAERCCGIVQRLSLLGRRGALERRLFDVGELVARVVRGFQLQATKARCELRVDVASHMPPLHGDATACEQLLANLIANALQVSPPGGVVVVRAAGRAGGLQLQVADQGPGVPAAHRSRGFEPFFTTKPVGSGTGLGLAVVDAVVRAHDGRLDVGDAPGGGAVFTVWLPWQDTSGAPAEVDPRPTPWPTFDEPAGALRLLVVDDDVVVRATIEREARKLGWAVVGTESGQHALSLLLADDATFDAIVCDLRMPGLSGQALHDHLAVRAPRWLQRIVFVTGDLASVDAAAFAARTRAPIVGKPFVARELLARVRQLVPGAAAG
ncbi:MAG: ATP-binding protein [Planctomycetota bacterium]